MTGNFHTTAVAVAVAVEVAGLNKRKSVAAANKVHVEQAVKCSLKSYNSDLKVEVESHWAHVMSSEAGSEVEEDPIRSLVCMVSIQFPLVSEASEAVRGLTK